MIQRNKFSLDDVVNTVLDQLPTDVLASSTTKFLDPAMAGGQFVLEIEERLRAAGHSDENIASRVFGYGTSEIEMNYAIKMNDLVGTYEVKNFINEETNMKNPIIIMNPPYNSDDTSRNNKAHRGQGDNLAKKFVIKSLELIGDDGKMVVVMPYGHRTYSPRLAETYRKNGLYKIDDVRHEFKNVATNPCAFYFDKSKVVKEVEDNYKQHTRQIPERNIGQIFRNQPGRLNREDYEADLTEAGKYRIVVTTGIQKYTDDKTIVDRMNDKTMGHWRVVMNCTTQRGKWGKLLVEGPDSTLSKSVHCLICQSEEEANNLKAHLETDEVLSILEEVKLNSCNSKKYLEFIPQKR